MKALAMLLVMVFLCSAAMAQDTNVEFAPAPAPDQGSGAAFLPSPAAMLCSSLVLSLLSTLMKHQDGLHRFLRFISLSCLGFIHFILEMDVWIQSRNVMLGLDFVDSVRVGVVLCCMGCMWDRQIYSVQKSSFVSYSIILFTLVFIFAHTLIIFLYIFIIIMFIISIILPATDNSGEIRLCLCMQHNSFDTT